MAPFPLSFHSPIVGLDAFDLLFFRHYPEQKNAAMQKIQAGRITSLLEKSSGK